MAVTIATAPTYPATGIKTKITFSLTEGGNYVKVFCTDAPLDSEEQVLLKSTGNLRTGMHEGFASDAWTFLPSKGGIYSLTIEEYTRGASAYGGGYQDSAASYLTETLISSNSVQLVIGQKITQPIGFGEDSATLVLFIHDDRIRAARADTHGFTAPAIVEPRTKKALTASLNSGVLAAAALLIDEFATNALGTLSTVIDNIITKFNAHRTQATVHNANDSDNVIPNTFRSASSPDGVAASLAAVGKYMDQHFRNDDGGTTTTPGGTGTKTYHVVGGINTGDWLNKPLFLSSSSMAEHIGMIANLWHSYEQHRSSAAVHTNQDATNSLTALPSLLNLHRLFLAEIQKQSPTAPASVNSGVTTLVHGAGFTEE